MEYNIERLYKYILKTEERINIVINCRGNSDKKMIVIAREGKSYLSNYPKFDDAIDVIHK